MHIHVLIKPNNCNNYVIFVTLLVKYAMLVDLKAHTGTSSSTFTQTVTHEHMQVNITVIAIFISDICADHTHTHNN